MDPLVLVALVAAGIALALSVLALWQIRSANQRLAEVTPDIRGLAQRVRGKEAEEALAAIFSQLETSSRTMEELRTQVADLDRIAARAVRRVGLVRFDANESIRGQLSFALCMLDGRDNGLMITSNYTLDHCRVFVRGILNGKALHDLMPEEDEALLQALNER